MPTQTALRPAAALAELACITGGRAGMSGRAADRALHDSGPADTVHKRVARLCISAGAGMVLIERGRREAAPAE